MSDVAHLRQVKPARPQLPVSWYFDPAIFELEKKLLFDVGANYVGHELMVPNVVDFHTLAHTDHSMVLVRNETAHHAWRAAGYTPEEHWRRWVKPLTD